MVRPIWFMSSLAVLIPLAGCGLLMQLEMNDAIKQYNAKAPVVKLGDSRDAVLSLLQPTQAALSMRARKPMEAFTETSSGQASSIEIHYFRSGWVEDGRTTDDEFTPYIFRNGVLVGIGWAALGGPKTISSPPPQEMRVNVTGSVQQQPRAPITCIGTDGYLSCQ